MHALAYEVPLTTVNIDHFYADTKHITTLNIRIVNR